MELTFPNSTQFSALTRMTGAAMASVAGFSVAEIDDLRIALDRVWTVLHDGTPEGLAVRVGFDAGDRQLHLEGCGNAPSAGAGAATDSGECIELEVTWRAQGMGAPG